MTARVSVVIPTRDAGLTLNQCLLSVRDQQGADVEIVVVDNGSRDDTVAIARQSANLVLAYGPERSAQRNHGWRACHGEIVIFIDADMTLESDVVAQALTALDTDAGLGALVIPEEAFGVGFLARCRALEKRLYRGDPAVEAARVFRRPVLENTGGFDERLTSFEDWDLADRVEPAGYRTGRISACIWHDEGRISLRRAFTKKRYYGRWLHAYRHRPDAPAPRPMSRSVLLTRWTLLARSPLLAFGLLLLKVTEAAGFASGAATARPKPRRTARL